MCLNTKRTRYRYLSMCSCCSVVSRYTFAVKKHLQRKHLGISSMNREKMIIPVRIESRHEKHIQRSLDRMGSVRNLRLKYVTPHIAVDNANYNNVERVNNQSAELTNKPNSEEISIICTICKLQFMDYITYFGHLSAKDHRHVKVSFKCPDCNAVFSYFIEFENHFKIHHANKELTISQLDCIIVSEMKDLTTNADNTQCPYCTLLFPELDHLYTHIRQVHFKQIETIRVNHETNTIEENNRKESILLAYNCRFCNMSFHCIGDIVHHMTEEHPACNKQEIGRSTRKRKVPQWLHNPISVQEDIDDECLRNVKRSWKIAEESTDSYQKKRLKVTGTKEKRIISNSISRKSNSVNVKKISRKVSPPISLKQITSLDTTKNRFCQRSAVQTLSQPVVLINRISVDLGVTKASSDRAKEEGKVGRANTHLLSSDGIDTIRRNCGTSDKIGGLGKKMFFEDHVFFGNKMLHASGQKSVGKAAIDSSKAAKLSEETAKAPEVENMNDGALLVASDDCFDVGDSDDDYIPDTVDNETEFNAGKILDIITLECPHCGCNTFRSKRLLNSHIRKKHSDIIISETSTKECTVINETRRKTVLRKKSEANDTHIVLFATKYKCPFCAFYLYHKEYVISHIQNEHSEVQHFSVNDIVKETVEIKKNDINRECFQCQHCNYVTHWKIDLNSHFRICKANCREDQSMQVPCMLPASWVEKGVISTNLVCSICKAVCQGCENFKNHRKHKHLDDKSDSVQFHSLLFEPNAVRKRCKELDCFMCPCCELIFSRKDSVRGHLKSIHTSVSRLDKHSIIRCFIVNLNTRVGQVDAEQHLEKTNSLDARVRGENNENCTDGLINVHTNYVREQSGKKQIHQLMDSICPENRPDVLKRKSLKGVHNENIDNIQRKTSYTDRIHTQKELLGGIYICPICESHRTLSKEDAVKHMVINHSEKSSEIVIILPDIFLDENSPVERRGRDKLALRCKSCDFTDNNLTSMVKHMYTTEKHIAFQSRDRMLHDKPDSSSHDKGKSNANMAMVLPVTQFSSYDKGNSGFSAIFDIIKVPSSENIISEETYICRFCDPDNKFRSKKTLLKHMEMQHEDEVNYDVCSTVYQMLDTFGGEQEMYFCRVCTKKIAREAELIEHFKSKHPDNVAEMYDTLRMNENHNEQRHCEICYKPFTDNTSLRRHLLLHVNRSKIHCAFCGVCFETKVEADHHTASVHSERAKMCNMCGKMFPNNKSLLKHVRSHDTNLKATEGQNTDSRPRTLCQHCGLETPSNHYKDHLIRYHSMHVTCACNTCTTQTATTTKSVMCDLCNAVFCTRFILKAHYVKQHSKEKVDSKGEAIADSKGTVDGPKEKVEYACDNCQATFKSKQLLQFHTHSCRNKAEAIRTSTRSLHLNASKHEMSFNEFDMEGSDADRTLLTADVSVDLIKEDIISFNENSESPYTCSLCQKTFRRKKYVYAHVRRKHTKDESKHFRCKICKMGFIQMAELKKHCRIHVGLRPHQCQICKKSYKTVTHLKEHKAIHVKNYCPYVCDYCGNGFRQHGALMAHVVRHDKLKPFKCIFCQKGFTALGDLKTHMDTYNKNTQKNDLHCNFCKAEFPNFFYLRKHIQKHYPVLPFHCSVCEEQFPGFRHMYRHKSETKHFTESEKADGKRDLQTPGRRFREYRPRQRKVEEETRIATTHLEKNSVKYINEDVATERMLDDQNMVDIEITESSTQNQSEHGRAALAAFEHDVMQSMFDVYVESDEASDYNKGQEVVAYQQDTGAQYIVETLEDFHAQCVVPGTSACTGAGDAEEPKSGSIDKLASYMAQNAHDHETSKTQTYETSDGSVIHVCVIKPNRK